MHPDNPPESIDDGLDALVDQLNARYQRLALAAEAAHADYLFASGSCITMRRKPAGTKLPDPPPASAYSDGDFRAKRA